MSFGILPWGGAGLLAMQLPANSRDPSWTTDLPKADVNIEKDEYSSHGQHQPLIAANLLWRSYAWETVVAWHDDYTFNV